MLSIQFANEHFQVQEQSTIHTVEEKLFSLFKIKPSSYTLRSFGGTIVSESNYKTFVKTGCHTYLTVCFRILGGKGGFGSLLKAQGALMDQKNSTNFESCRDLQGRRLKTINEAKHLATYLAKEPERKKLKQDKINKKIEDGLKEVVEKKIIFDDTEFIEALEKGSESVRDAVEIAFMNKMNGGKKKEKKVVVPSWDESYSSSSDEEEEVIENKGLHVVESIVEDHTESKDDEIIQNKVIESEPVSVSKIPASKKRKQQK